MSNKLSTTLMGAAAVAMALSACSSEDTVINEPRAMKEISFNLTANRPTRASSYYNNVTDITRFKVSAWVNKNTSDQTAGIGKAYFESEGLTKKTLTGETSATWVYDDSHIRYWPNNGETLDFYAWVDNKKNAAVAASEGTSAVEENESKGYTFGWGDGNRAQLTGIPQEDAAEMVDLLYANEFGKEQTVNATATSEKVQLNMKHALAQIGVTVKVVNPKIQVQVTEVKLVNLIDKGDFMFATKDNATEAEDEAQWTVAETHGTVSVTATANNSTIICPDEENNNVGVDLTTNGSVKNTFMVLPYNGYTTADADANKIDMGTDKDPATGTYIGLKCKIWNIANPKATVNLDNELLIYGTSTEYKYLYVPVALNTEMGKNYTYTITFGTGHAGFNEEGQNTLVKIDWNVTSLDGWDSVPATGTDEKIEQ